MRSGAVVIGSQYWTTGIVLTPKGGGTWSAEAKFFDDGFCDDASTEGVLMCRYILSDVSAMIDVLAADLEALGIRLGTEVAPMTIYIAGDGEHSDIEYPPDWKEVATREAKRKGWRAIYEDSEQP